MNRILAGLTMLFVAAQPASGYDGWGYDKWDWGYHATSVYAGYWNSADFGDSLGAGWKLNLGIKDHFHFDFQVAYFGDFSKDQGAATTDLEVIPVEFGLSYDNVLREPLEFYAGAGMGWYQINGSLSVPEDVSVRSNLDSDWGYYAATGLMLRTGKKAGRQGITEYVWTLELMYRGVTAQGTILELDPEPLTKDGSLNGIALNLAVGMRF